jgi:hypothetical protein
MTLPPKTSGLRLENTAVDTHAVSLTVANTCPSDTCPICKHQTSRLHSHYQRLTFCAECPPSAYPSANVSLPAGRRS